MIHLPQFIVDLALILGAAGVVTVLFRKLKQPLVLGYIVAGFLVGPNFALFPTITETENIEVWSEIGVIFLLFALGLEFSFKKLLKVGTTASVTALVKILAMLVVGYLTGQALGWSNMDSIFLGGILSISSTTITIRAFDELGIKGQKFAGLVFGILIIEDLVAIVLLVLLSTISISRQFSGADMLISVSKLVFFLVLCFTAGIFFLPTVLKRTKKLMNDEMLLIVSLALCLMMVFIASAAGFSPALGAFMMGSILAETTFAEKIEHLIRSVKDLFGAIFFVSVGMLIMPDMLVPYAVPILVISAVTIVGKFFSSVIGALLSGQPLKPSVQVGMSLAQIGEFSFIIASLGLTLKVTSDFLYPIAVAVSAITTLATPYMIKWSEPVYLRIHRMLPARTLKAITRYSSGAQSLRVVSDWKKLLRTSIVNMVIFSVLVIAVILLSSQYIVPFINERTMGALWGRVLAEIVTVLLMAPFLWALAFRKVRTPAAFHIWQQQKYRGPLLMLRLSRMLLALFYVGYWLSHSFSYTLALGIILFVVVFLGIFSKRIQRFYNRLERRFLSNYYERDKEDKTATIVDQDQLAPWDAHLANFEVYPEWQHNGKTLAELSLREKLGINIAMIRRGSLVITAPGREERVYPGDRLYVIGTDKQIERFTNFLRKEDDRAKEADEREIVLQQLLVEEDSALHGISIRESGVREKTEGLIIGVERKGRRILNPDSTLVFETGDVVWIVGNKELISALR